MSAEQEKKPRQASQNILNIFKNKATGVEYRTLNFLIKVVGILSAFAILIFIIRTIGESIFQPLFTFLSILSPFILGIVFAWLLTPVINALVKRNWKATHASLVVTMVGVILLSLLIGGFAYVTFSSVIRFFTGGYDLNLLFDGVDIVTLINSHINDEVMNDGLLQFVVQAGVMFGFVEQTSFVNEATAQVYSTYQLVFQAGNSFVDIIAQFAGYMWKFVIAAMVVGFMLPNFSNFGPNVKSIIPKSVKKEWSDMIDIIGESFSNYMQGALMIATIVGSTYVVGLMTISLLSSTVFYVEGQTSILSFQNLGIILVFLTILTFGILGTVTNLIPYAGPFIGGVPIVIIIALNDTTQGYWVTWATALLIVLVQSLESLFLQPYVMGKQTRLHPVAILLGLTLFGALFGFVGLLISTPIISVARSVINYYNEKYDIF